MKKLFYILGIVLMLVASPVFAMDILDSEENVDPDHESPDHHIAAVSIQEHIDNNLSLQEKINEINSQGGSAFLAHPNYGSLSYSIELLLSLNDYIGIDGFNGYCQTKQGTGQALDKWDAVLSSGRKIWAYGVDDSHNEDQRGYGRTYVYGEGDIWDNYKSGNCYIASNSMVKYTYISYYAPLKRITVKLSNSATIKFVGKNSTIYETHTGTGWSYYIQGDEGYIRVQAVNPNGRAFTQPFWIDGENVENPYQVTDPNDVLSFAKANLHCHGDYGELVDWYSTNGYSLLAITNYNRISYAFSICDDIAEE